MTAPQRPPGQGPSWKGRLWAPLLAGVIIGIIYIPRVDAAMYFLHGLRAQGIILSKALAEGRGFIDPSLPGHPAHVREPPLFYLMLAVIIKSFGLKILPLKALCWAGYTIGAMLAVALLQKREKPWLALLATVAGMASPKVFIFFTGPATEFTYPALSIGALLAMEKWMEVSPDQEDTRPAGTAKNAGLAILIVLLVGGAIFTRSLGIALLIAAFAAFILHKRKSTPLKTRTLRAMAISIPVIIMLGLWNVRTAGVPNPAGYNYIDWFLMDLEPDSPEMMAIDFHAPLVPPITRDSATGVARRIARHVAYYPETLTGDLFFFYPVFFAKSGGLLRPVTGVAVVLGLTALLALGLIASERGRPPAVVFYLLVYTAAVMVWPMNDPRLLYPLYPFASFYMATGALILLRRLGRIAKAPGPSAAVCVGAALVALIAVQATRDMKIQRYYSSLPAITFRPGFEVRFVDRETRDSFELLRWARLNTEPEAVLMYHSPPPCALVSGRVCSSIPFTGDLKRIRDFAVEGGADYLVIDEWGKSYPRGPGWFVEKLLRPTVRAFPGDFEKVYAIPGTESMVLRVKKMK